MEDEVVYLQCPHCKKGWYGKFLYDEFENGTLKGYYIEGLAPTNLMSELTCLNCGHKYTPIINELEANPDCHVMHMWEWVAKLLTTCRGH